MEAHERRTLPEGWEWKRLGDVAQFFYGYPFDSSKFNDKGSGTPLIRIRNLIDGKTETYYDGEFDESYIIKNGDTLIGMDGEFNIVKWAGQEALLNQRVCKLNITSEELLPAYAYRVLVKILKRIEDKTPYVTVKHLSAKHLNLIQIPLPPLPIQRRIVSILEKAEETKKLRAQADELTERLLKSLFFDMFGDPVKNPKGWETKMIRDIADIIVPTRDKPKKFDGDIPWVTLPDVLSTALFVNDSKYKLSTLSAKEVSARLFPKDTVLLSCAGTLGRVAIAKCALYSNQQFYGLVCKTDKISPIFLAFNLLRKPIDHYHRISGNFTIPFFRKEIALNINVFLPPLPLQQKFARIVEKIEAMRQSQNQSKQQIEDLFSALMQKAFRGEI